LDGRLLEQRLVLMHLPPNSPKPDRIEIVWKHLKYLVTFRHVVKRGVVRTSAKSHGWYWVEF
jgi:hypothetical protein